MSMVKSGLLSIENMGQAGKKFKTHFDKLEEPDSNKEDSVELFKKY